MSSQSTLNSNLKLQCMQITPTYHIESKTTAYEIVLSTQSKQWSIKKRYSDFHALHTSLITSRELSLSPNSNPIDVQSDFSLPPKRWFRGNSLMIVEERKVGWKRYLNTLFSLSGNLLKNKDLIDFIEIDKEVLLQLLQENEFRNIYQSSTTKSCSTNISSPVWNSYVDKGKLNNHPKKNCSKLPSQDVNLIERNHNAIENLLHNWDENKEHQSEIIKEFAYFFDRQMTDHLQFTESEISFLFTGKDRKTSNSADNLMFSVKKNKGRSQYKGWLNYIGNYHTNKIGAEACLAFLSKVINFESNLDYEKWWNVLISTETKYLSLMQLNKIIHLECCKSLMQKAFKILKILHNYQFEFEKLFSFSDYEYVNEKINSDIL